jgi:hypothetical protein
MKLTSASGFKLLRKNTRDYRESLAEQAAEIEPEALPILADLAERCDRIVAEARAAEQLCLLLGW